MVTDQPSTGGCLCGGVTYTLAGAPLLTAICHCTHCQKHSGSAFSVNHVVRRSDITITGEMGSFDDRGESGNLIRRRFCKSCGSPIMTEPIDHPDIAYLKAGTLDDRKDILPSVQVWCASAQPWWNAVPQLARFEQYMPS